MNSFNKLGTMLVAIQDRAVKTVTYYESPRHTIKLTKRHRPRHAYASVSYVLTHGRPNYAERQFIKKAVRAGCHFPIAKLQFKFYPVRKCKGR